MTLTGVKVGSRTLFVIILLAVFISSYRVISREVTGTNTLSEENDPNEGKVATPLRKSSNRLIPDPTGQARGYYRPNQDQDYFELFGSRGQTYRHFYNLTSGKYTYQSDYLVKKAGVIEGTEWITAEEYPTQFVVILEDKSINYFETMEEINAFWESAGKTASMAVGIESFGGLMGFQINNHSQYLYWPRFRDGSLDLTGDPLYAIYPRIHVETMDGQVLKQVLTDKNLSPTDAKDTFVFSITPSSLEIQFSQKNVDLFNSQWDFIHGFKYKQEDQQFHMITKIRCQNRPFQDIGLTYEITKSPMTSIQPELFGISNMTHSLIRSANESWNADEYGMNYEPWVEIFSTNGEGVIFSFDDMKKSGFTKKLLKHETILLPNQLTSTALGAGMQGYGYYEPNTWIDIDPSIGFVKSTDKYDLYCRTCWYTQWYTSNTRLYVGKRYHSPDTYIYDSFIAFDTGIKHKVVNTFNTLIRLYSDSCTMDDNDEGMGIRVYNVPGNNNDSQARENSTSFGDTDCYKTKEKVLWGYRLGLQILPDLVNLSNYWAEYRDVDDNFINFRFFQYNCDDYTNDYYRFRDSQFPGTEYDPDLYFDYDLGSWGLGATICNNASGHVNWGTTTKVETRVKIPDISNVPSDVIYSILSVKTADNYFLQAGVGFATHKSTWRAVAVYSPGTIFHYKEFFTTPEFSANDIANFTIWSEKAGDKWAWWYYIENEDESESVSGKFLDNSNSPYFKNEAQEVMTLESYSSIKSDFGSTGRIIFKMLECKVNGTTVDDDIYIEATLHPWKDTQEPGKDYHVGGAIACPAWITIQKDMGTNYGQVWWLFDQSGGSNEGGTEIDYE
ncbi:MAG: hypothetical protein ACFFCQ_10375 [Promethearchaeota archaeon]